MANKSKMLSLFSNLYKFSLVGISRCWCRCWCWNTTCNLPGQSSCLVGMGRGQRVSLLVWLGDVFVVVYDVASNFLQLIACNSNTNSSDNRHFLTASRPRFALFAFSFRATVFFLCLPFALPWFSCCFLPSYASFNCCLRCLWLCAKSICLLVCCMKINK